MQNTTVVSNPPSPWKAIDIAQDALSMFLRLRDEFGYSEYKARNEVIFAMSDRAAAEAELRHTEEAA